MPNMSFRRALAATVLLLLADGTAKAGLIGATATSQYYAYGAANGAPATFTVDSRAHAPFYGIFDVTVTGSQIIYQYKTSGLWSSSATSLSQDGLKIDSGNLLRFSGAPTITGVSIDSSTTMLGLTPSRVTFNGTSVAVSWVGLAFNPSTVVVLNVATAANAPAAVDEPAAASLMVLGFGGLAFAGWNGRRDRARG